MGLPLHLSLHILTGILAGYVVWKIWRKPGAAFSMAFAGGVLIDIDHLIDYFLAFGWNFNLNDFAGGCQFLKSGKIYILFHGWEYGIILLVLAIWVLKNKTAKSLILALALGLLFHLTVDSFINKGMKFPAYSVVYRIKNNFESQKLATPEHYQDRQAEKNDKF